jgi:hypothetical protein|tara:strand:+ start:7798 stop:9849 length:2052 start_codon:yes stop_codon:yes gene_type:complete
MAADEVVMNVKSNIKQVTADTKDLTKALSDAEKEFAEINEVVSVQNDVIRGLETNLMNLKQTEDKMGKGSWEASLNKMPEKIKAATHELDREKDSLKTLESQQKKSGAEVKKFNEKQKDSASAAKEGIGNFSLMGVSLNGLKASFAKIIPTIKAMFGSIKAGIMSTGIGVLLIAFGALITYFTNTKEGADKLKVLMAGLGAVMSVLTDLVSSFGKKIFDAFSNPKQAIADLWEAIKTNLMNRIQGIADTFIGLGAVIKSALSLDWDGVKEGAADLGTALIQVGTGMDEIQQKNFAQGIIDITTEIKNETAAMMDLERQQQVLRDAENEFLVTKAKTNRAIAEARLLSDDETLSAEDRIAALKEALALEAQSAEADLKMAKTRMNLQAQEMALSENMAEDERKLAELRAAVIDTEAASFKMKKKVLTEVYALELEIEADRVAKQKEKEAEEKTAADLKLKEAADLKSLQDENFLMEIEDLKERALAKLEIEHEAALKAVENHANFAEMKEAIDQKYANAKKSLDTEAVKFSEMTSKEQLGIASNALGSMATIMGKESKAGKAAAIGQATIQTYLSAQKAFTSLAGIPVVGPVLGGIAAAGAIVSGFKNIQAIKSGGGGGKPAATTPAASGGGAEAVAPAQEMMSGKFELGNVGGAPEPIKAFVVTDDMTNSQDQLAQIRNRATI